jgi:phosphoglycolate phosphatase
MDSMIDFYEAVNEALKHYGGRPVSFNVFYRLLLEHRLDDVIPPGTDPVAFWRFFRRNYRSMHGWPVKGAWRFLYYARLTSRRIIIVSGRECHEDILWHELRRYDLDDYVDEIYTLYHLEVLGGIEEELFDKTWLIKYVLRKEGVEPGETVYLGDYRNDLTSSRRAGVWFIGVAFTRERGECLRRLGAEYVARDLDEALYYLLEIERRRGRKGL